MYISQSSLTVFFSEKMSSRSEQTLDSLEALNFSTYRDGIFTDWENSEIKGKISIKRNILLRMALDKYAKKMLMIQNFSKFSQDKQFGKLQLYKGHVNPEAMVETSIKHYGKYTLQKAYMGRAFFWGLSPSAGDIIHFKFHAPIHLKRFVLLKLMIPQF